jgi:hypothetical protein
MDMPTELFAKVRDKLVAYRFVTEHERNRAFWLFSWLSGQRNGSGSIEPIVDIDISSRTAMVVITAIEEVLPHNETCSAVRQRVAGYRVRMAGAATTAHTPGPTSLV